jgi:hypothetical protein
MSKLPNENKSLKPNESGEVTSSAQLYTIAADRTGMKIPGITQLLDRKKMESLRSKNDTPPDPSVPLLDPLPVVSDAESKAEPSARLEFEKRDVTLDGDPMSFELDMTAAGAKRAPAGSGTERESKPEPEFPPIPNDAPSEIAQALANLPPPGSAPSQSHEPMSFQVVDENLEPSNQLNVRKAVRRNGQPVKSLEIWKRDDLIAKGGTEPLSKVMSILIGGGAHKLIAFTSSDGENWNPSVCYNPGSRAQSWKSINWSQSTLPDLWKMLSRASALEIGPLGKTANLSSSRAILRTALDVRAKEWLSLIDLPKLGSERTVIAIVSTESIQAAASAVISAFQSNQQKAA